MKKALTKVAVDRDTDPITISDPKSGNKKLSHDNFKQWALNVANKRRQS